MNEAEKKELKIKTVDSILGDFEESIEKTIARFKAQWDAYRTLFLSDSEHVVSMGKGYDGEIHNIDILLGCGGSKNANDWADTIARMSAIVKRSEGNMFKHGDFFYVPVNVPEITIGNYKFPKVEPILAKIVVTAAYANKIILNFEDVLFHAPQNKECTNKGGFKESLLAKYLNEHFLKNVFGKAEQYLAENKDGLKVVLPTYFEVFGDDDSDYQEVNWGEEGRHPYFEKCTNRIKVRAEDRDDTNWWWLSTPHAGGSSGFCGVNIYGSVNSNDALIASGGVAPAICIS
jgi:hypothetical protein